MDLWRDGIGPFINDDLTGVIKQFFIRELFSQGQLVKIRHLRLIRTPGGCPIKRNLEKSHGITGTFSHSHTKFGPGKSGGTSNVPVGHICQQGGLNV